MSAADEANAALGAQVADLVDRVEQLQREIAASLKPLKDISGIRGITITRSESNIVIGGVPALAAATGTPGGPVPGPGGSVERGSPVIVSTDTPDIPFTPGDAFTPGAAVAYESRTRGGNASLVGFAEYTSPSTPAKKYRTKTLSGTVAAGVFNDSGCTIIARAPSTSTGAYGVTTVTNSSGYSMTGTITKVGPQRYRVDCVWSPGTGNQVFGAVQMRKENGELGNNAESPAWSYGFGTIGTTTESGSFYFSVPNGEFWNVMAEVQNDTGGGTGYTYGNYIWLEDPSTLAALTETLTYSGTATYDGTSGAGPTNAGTVTGNLIDTTSGVLTAVSASSLASIDDASSRIGSGNFATATNAATTHDLGPSSTRQAISGTALYRKVTSSSLRDTLTVEDTDSDAITRLLSDSGTTWSSFASDALPAGDSDYDARTTGFSFDYYHSEVKATYSGMPPGQVFIATVRVVSVSHVNSTLASHQVVSYPLTADGSGAATFTHAVIPAVPGFTYRVQSVSHFL